MAPSAPALRRLLSCFAGGSNGAPSALEPATKKKNLVFMGSPQVSASVLGALLDASAVPNSSFQVAAIVTQPPSTRDRGRKLMPSAVAQYALDWGFPRDLILTPDRTGDENFLANFRALNPELCVTAAYGNILPNKFLEIPPYGTVNIHPSLLPLYRGAAPVQRALQDGVKETGVSLAYTVRALDAGPVIAYERVEVDDCMKAPELLMLLFDLATTSSRKVMDCISFFVDCFGGSKILIRELPSIFDGSAKLKAKAQDDSKATLAPKLTTDESWLSFDQEAKLLHNKVRAFAGWPGTRARIQVIDGNGNPNTLEIKIITTRVSSAYEQQGEADEITFVGDALVIPCAGQSALEVLELQLPGKKVMTAIDFRNGLRGQMLRRLI